MDRNYRAESVPVPGADGQTVRYDVLVDPETGLDVDPQSGRLRTREETVQLAKEVYAVGHSALADDLDRYNKWRQGKGAKLKGATATAVSTSPAASATAASPDFEDLSASADSLREQGNTVLGRGLWQRAVDLYTAGLEKDDSSVALWANRSEAMLRGCRYAAALHDADRCLALSPSHAKAQYRRSRALLGLGRIDEAEAAAAAFSADPTWADLATNCAAQPTAALVPFGGSPQDGLAVRLQRAAVAGQPVAALPPCARWWRYDPAAHAAFWAALGAEADAATLAQLRFVPALLPHLAGAPDAAHFVPSASTLSGTVAVASAHDAASDAAPLSVAVRLAVVRLLRALSASDTPALTTALAAWPTAVCTAILCSTAARTYPADDGRSHSGALAQLMFAVAKLTPPLADAVHWASEGLGEMELLLPSHTAMRRPCVRDANPCLCSLGATGTGDVQITVESRTRSGVWLVLP